MIKHGVGSNFLNRIDKEFKLEVGFKSAFSISRHIIENGAPLIIFCHGTAVTPFISILKRIQQVIEKRAHENLKITMFYGIRDYEEDFMFQDTLIRLFKLFGPLSKLHVCQSRPVQEVKNLNE